MPGWAITVRLVNAASNRNLSGTVTAAGMVEVHTGSALVAALNSRPQFPDERP